MCRGEGNLVIVQKKRPVAFPRSGTSDRGGLLQIQHIFGLALIHAGLSTCWVRPMGRGFDSDFSPQVRAFVVLYHWFNPLPRQEERSQLCD